jgi:hypothetical protein
VTLVLATINCRGKGGKMMNKVVKITFTGAVAMIAVSAQASDRHVTIVNETNSTMMRFYASNAGKTSWEEDILGSRVLKPGQSVRINVDDGSGACVYDFRADFNDGDKLTRNGINVCEIGTYRYTAD